MVQLWCLGYLKSYLLSFSSEFSTHLLAVWRHISEDTEQKFALLPRVKGCRDDDITALLQLLPEEDAAWIDVDGTCYFLLGCVHTVLSIQFHLQNEKEFGFTSLKICSVFFLLYVFLVLYVCVLTWWISKPIARFSPFPSWGVALFSFCCKQISTSSSTFFTSNTYWRKKQKKRRQPCYTLALDTYRSLKTRTRGPTWGFCRKVVLWLMQPPDRLRRGSWRWIQDPLITSSSQVLWILK